MTHTYMYIKNKYVCIYMYISISPWFYNPCGPWPLFQFLNLYAVCRISSTGDQLVARPLPTHRTTQTQNKRTQASIAQVGFVSTIPVFEREKIVHALGWAVTVIGIYVHIHDDIYIYHALGGKIVILITNKKVQAATASQWKIL
jgi:hypothetical protein